MSYERNGIVIFDANVLIYLSKYVLNPVNILVNNPSISIVTKIEALGFRFTNNGEYHLLLAVCNELNVISLSDEIANTTISLRKEHKIKLPDAIIYATALVKNEPLLTNNTGDFKSLGKSVELINPFDL